MIDVRAFRAVRYEVGLLYRTPPLGYKTLTPGELLGHLHQAEREREQREPNLFAAQTALQALLPIALDRDSGAPSPWPLLSIAQRLLGCMPVLSATSA